MAIEFNGTTDRIDYGNVINWTSRAQTWAAWVWWDNFDASEYLLADIQADDTTFGMLIFRSGTETTLRHTTVTSATAQVTCTNSGAISTGSWQHILMTWNGQIGAAATDSLFYVNGVVQTNGAGTNNGSGTPITLDGKHCLGGRISADDRNFDGRMAEVGRWDRVLVASEIASLVAGALPIDISHGLRSYRSLRRDGRDHHGQPCTFLDGTVVVPHPPTVRNRTAVVRGGPRHF